jgi:small conductance mechanosensitive channel
MDTTTVSDVTKVASKDIPNMIEKIYTWAGDHGPIIVLILFLAIICFKLLSLSMRHTISLLSRNASLSLEQAQQRTHTLSSVLDTIVRFVIIFVAGIAIIDASYPPGVTPPVIAAILASASIFGVALGFGAQTLVRDFISGFFILFENQYCVGDVVQIGSSKGTVEYLSLRITIIRDFEGKLHTLPNSEIKTVVNESRGWSRSIVDIGIPSSQNAKTAIAIINARLSKMDLSDDIRQNIIEWPNATGIEEFSEEAMILRITATVQSGFQNNLADYLSREIRSVVQAELREKGIAITTK